MTNHQNLIREQFTKQAIPFSSAPAIKNEDTLKLLVEFTNASESDIVLDVACGPGIVVCSFAEVVAHVTGIDLTPAMIERAQTLQTEKHLTNISWKIGDILPLPFADESFSIVTSRYAFHHFEHPKAVIGEMKRVCKAGGKVVLIDQVASANPEQANKLNQMERLRDPSHIRALTLLEMEKLFVSVKLHNLRKMFYKLDAELEMLLKTSFPNENDGDKVRQMIIDSLEDDGMGVNTRMDNGKVWISYPITILMAEKKVESTADHSI